MLNRAIILAAALAVPTVAGATPIYWNLFNFEEEDTEPAVYATYDSLTDMLNDTNRTGQFVPDGFNVAQNVVGSGSDGSSFWNLFNFEEEDTEPAVYATYDSLTGMLNDTNRTGAFVPDGFNVAQNVVGSGSDGSSFWNLFNFEGEDTEPAVYATYDSLTDMLNDSNRTGAFVPDGFNVAQNVVGSGAFSVPKATPIPLPGSALLLLAGALAAAAFNRRKSRSWKSAALTA